ncbi:hypothetical protein KP509_09G100400 [Ceratopteris richardii]|uniref:Uncharacterized protein n=1 Tax=Ceratopteris richardii TaxID=49495 RepID=A0A8T2UDC4_CERRI|nr:hypothetical protein KP509_09G100400 [Ceratopteris richardii]
MSQLTIDGVYLGYSQSKCHRSEFNFRTIFHIAWFHLRTLSNHFSHHMASPANGHRFELNFQIIFHIP